MTNMRLVTNGIARWDAMISLYPGFLDLWVKKTFKQPELLQWKAYNINKIHYNVTFYIHKLIKATKRNLF